jgi:AcrR family transcriptional regulator
MILEAAEAIVSEAGLGQLSAREIARRIGYSPGTIYNMFDNLDDVVVTVEARLLDRLAERLRTVKAANPATRILRLSQAYLAFTHENPRLWNLLFEHHLPADQLLPEWYMSKLAGPLRLLEEALEPFLPGEDKERRERAARVLWSAVHGITSLSTSGKLSIITNEAAHKLAEDLVRNYLAGLRAGAKRSKKR